MGLKRELGLLHATMMGIGGIIEAGVFVVLACASGLAGSALVVAQRALSEHGCGLPLLAKEQVQEEEKAAEFTLDDAEWEQSGISILPPCLNI